MLLSTPIRLIRMFSTAWRTMEINLTSAYYRWPMTPYSSSDHSPSAFDTSRHKSLDLSRRLAHGIFPTRRRQIADVHRYRPCPPLGRVNPNLYTQSTIEVLCLHGDRQKLENTNPKSICQSLKILRLQFKNKVQKTGRFLTVFVNCIYSMTISWCSEPYL